MTLSSVFVDSSVFFSASVSPNGKARDLILAGFEEQVVLCISNYVIGEARRNIRKKSPKDLDSLELLLDSGLFQVDDPSPELIQHVATAIEGKDAPIIAGAIANNCTFLATYDRVHLLSQAERILEIHGIVTTTPAVILENLRDAT